MTEPDGIPITEAVDDISGVILIEQHRGGSKKVVKRWRSTFQLRAHVLAALLAAGGGVGGAVWKLAKLVVVTRDEWVEARERDAAFQAKVTEALMQLQRGQ